MKRLPKQQNLNSARISLSHRIYETVLVFFFSLEDGVGLVPKHGYVLTLAYYTFPRGYQFGERRWNDILTGEN
jgi:hypothetical protein